NGKQGFNMKKLFLAIMLSIIFMQYSWAELELILEPVQEYNQEGHAVPLLLKLKNNGPEAVEVPQYLVPFFDFDLEIKNSQQQKVQRKYSIYNLAYLKPIAQQVLKSGEIYTQRINDARELYTIDKVDRYTLQASYYQKREKIKALQSKGIFIDVGNVAGDQGFLIFSDTAYLQKSFCFTTVYPAGSYLLRDFSNNYFILGAKSSFFQAGIGYADGAYGGLKWQLINEKNWWPALSAQYFKWQAGREVMTTERAVLGYWTENRSSGLTLSKRLPWRTHIHLGLKRFEIMSKLESSDPENSLHNLRMVALDQTYEWGTLIYESVYDNYLHLKTEGIMFKFLPSWEPQLGIGLMRYHPVSGQEITMFFFSVYFNIDNFLLGFKF
ncbi:MAG: hypothetical protein KKA19_00495, partial [Candidatus Margulisbacteria bacterium]|nr:hypothetical protein [Candidatus Margulisiibacteriota bacterium]